MLLVIRILFPKHDTMLGAPILSYLQKKLQHFCKIISKSVVGMLHVCRRNDRATVKAALVFIKRACFDDSSFHKEVMQR
jgi:hypothetical protein